MLCERERPQPVRESLIERSSVALISIAGMLAKEGEKRMMIVGNRYVDSWRKNWR